jgi:molybdopterin-biosynthesis enzyme MoeA-like protein
MNFGLIVIGDEILSGKRQDKHLPKVVELLSARGLSLSWARYVGDDRPRITAALREAFASGEAVFSCGGIGATPDDHTRQCAAAALDLPLELHPEARLLILERMRDVAVEQGKPFEPERPDNLHRLNMGRFPRGATLITNPYNKIPGFSLGEVHFVPGFPVMAHPMIEALLDSRYRPLHGLHRQSERGVVVYGGIEAALTPLMEHIESDGQDRRRRDEDGEGKRSQVRRLPFHRHPRQGAARDRARVAFRRRQVQHVGPRLRRLVHRRLEGHRSLRHAADARSEHRQHRPVLRRADADPDLRRGRARRRQALRARPALLAKRAEAYLKSSGLGDTAYFGPEPEFFIFDRCAGTSTCPAASSRSSSEEAPGTPARTRRRQQGPPPGVKGGYFPVPPVDSTQDMRARCA